MATVGIRAVALIFVDVVAIYILYTMMSYLTNVWKIGFTRAAAIVNAFWGLVAALPLFLKFIVDSIIGNYWMLLISSIAYTIGLGLLTMSTPPVLANAMETCTKYKPECIGHVQKLLFYIALPLIAFGMSGHLTCWKSFIIDQIIPLEDDESESDDEDDNDGILLVFFFGMVSGIISEMSGHLISWNTLKEEEQLENIPPEELQEAFNETTSWRFHIIIPSFVVGTIVAIIALFYIKPWSLRFGIPAICTLVATLLFISGSWSYKIYYKTREISPLTVFLRVFVAAISKLFYRSPKDATKLYEIQDPQLDSVPHTKSLRCLDKAAIVIPTKPLEEQEKNKWRLCRVTEVEETKTIMRMIPVWMTFILCGVVSAIGFTFFIEQLNHLNPKVGRLKVPIVALLYCHEQAQNKFAKFAASLGQSGSRKLAPSIGIAVSMVLGILCCITAAKVENRRLGVVIKHGLVDKPDERVPMTMFWLLPQFILLGGFTGVFKYSAVSFFADQSPISTRNYLPFFVSAVFGVGTLGSVLSVYVVGKVSEKGGKKNWFQHDLNGSRLDKYYWTLSWLMAINLVVFIVVAILYRYKESELEDQQGEEFGGIDEPSLSDDNPKCFCFCP